MWQMSASDLQTTYVSLISELLDTLYAAEYLYSKLSETNKKNKNNESDTNVITQFIRRKLSELSFQTIIREAAKKGKLVYRIATCVNRNFRHFKSFYSFKQFCLLHKYDSTSVNAIFATAR